MPAGCLGRDFPLIFLVFIDFCQIPRLSAPKQGAAAAWPIGNSGTTALETISRSRKTIETNRSLVSLESAVSKPYNPVIVCMSQKNRSGIVFWGPGEFWRFRRFRSLRRRPSRDSPRIFENSRGFSRFSKDPGGFGRIFGDFQRISFAGRLPGTWFSFEIL